MSVVKLATLHVNVAYGLVREAWVVEGVAAEVLDIAAVAEVAAAAAAQDIEGAQAMAEGATAHEIVLLGGEVTAGRHQDLVHGVSAGRRRCRRLLPEITAGHHGEPET